ncbi:MAG: tRNA preQ1(34) S-adenosylmethionine ribosyltransferase-isomerase QueA [Candidatus Omnitrophota bacterium]
MQPVTCIHEYMNIEKFNYHLPPELIAQYPLKKRDQSRLLVINRATEEIIHTGFKNILDFFNPGDALVLNNTKVKPARIIGKIEKKEIDVLLVERIKKNCYWIKAKPLAKIKKVKKIVFDNGNIVANYIHHPHEYARVMLILEFECKFDIEEKLEQIGMMPLPPYIKRKTELSDKSRYQTIYAQKQGAIAAPTAGLHFSKQILMALNKKNIETIYVTLHVGLGTFEPIRTNDISEHKMHKEDFEISAQTTETIRKVKQQKSKICAVGTTVARVLETVTQIQNNQIKIIPQAATTEIFIYPPYEFKACDMLITNFHLPKSTLLMLVSAFAGRELILKAYAEAVKEKYRFFSYGDCMLII